MIRCSRRSTASGSSTWDDYADRLPTQSTAWDRRGWTWFRSSLVAWKPSGVGVDA